MIIAAIVKIMPINNIIKDFNYMYNNNIHVMNNFSEPVYVDEIARCLNKHVNVVNTKITYNNKGVHILDKNSQLEYLKDFEYTLVFYEAPHRIVKTLEMMLEIFGDRYISISREISKLHESVFVGKISQALENTSQFKGEFVIVVSPNEEEIVDYMNIVDRVNMYIRTGLTSMEAIKKVAKERKIPKNEVYKEYHGGN